MPPTTPSLSSPPDPPVSSIPPQASPARTEGIRPVQKTPKLSDLVGTRTNGNNGGAHTSAQTVTVVAEDMEFTDEALQTAWNEFAEQRKMYLAEYQLLTQPFDRRDNEIVIHLHNPIQDTILNTIKGDLLSFLRKNLQNRSITLVVEEATETESRTILYTPKEKFDFLLEKYPQLKALRDRLGLDTDY